MVAPGPPEPGSAPVAVSLIIPAFNERARLGKNLDRIVAFLRAQPYASEVIVVDDGSHDGTGEWVEAHHAGGVVQLCRLPANRGKGEAVRQGMFLGRGHHLCFSDADLSVPIESLPVFLSRLAEGADVAIGSRRAPGAVIEVPQPRYREALGQAYTGMARAMLGLSVSDVTCGFKGFRRSVARDVFRHQRLRDWGFDAEILYIARLRGYRVSEVPVRWRNDGATRVRLPRDVVRSLVGLVRIRAYAARGRYDP
jgi:glycosyltransferase involved in cell wall biosynthesis